jgi:ABC-2 type transport system ATP-binding protein
MVEVHNLSFQYSKQRTLFGNLSLELPAGSITGLLGKNGAGKTTLLKLLTGLVHPQSGHLKVLERYPRKREVNFLNDVFFVPEEYYLPSVSIGCYLEANSSFYPGFDKERMQIILDDFELSAQDNISKLSYGQKKKFLISFALATRCRFLVLDEPTNGLDIPSKSLFRKIIAGHLDETQLVLISTHQVKDVENLLDQVIILDEGKVVFQEDLLKISAGFAFLTTPSLDRNDIIYSESIPGGYKVIVANEGLETAVDMELLFNAVTSGKKLTRN